MDNNIKIAIWGSCISREIINYCDDVEVTAYILQNPIHTMFGKPFKPTKGLKGTSGFATRCLEYECSKTAYDVIKKNKAEYLLIDTCDSRNDYYEMNDEPGCRICQSLSSKMNFGKDEVYGKLFSLKSVYTIDYSEWKELVKKFCSLIKNIYTEENIILNEFEFATDYIKDGVVNGFENIETYKKQNIITNQVAELIKDNLKNIKVMSKYENPLGDYFHHLGNSPMHFTDEVYKTQASKLEKIIRKAGN